MPDIENGIAFIAILARLVGVILSDDAHRSFGVFVLFCMIVVPAFGQTSVSDAAQGQCANYAKHVRDYSEYRQREREQVVAIKREFDRIGQE